MKVSYFPGCTLKTKAKDLDEQARACAEILGVTLEEISNWQCCGGAFTTASDEIATKLSSVRALMEANKKGQPLLTVCSACHNVIKQTNVAMKENPDNFAFRANMNLAPDNYNGEAEVIHYLELLRDKVGYDKIKEKVVKPLEGLKVACYYGCLLLRPSKVMAMDDAENPTIMEDLVKALGGEPVYYAYKNECCGGYIALEDAESAMKKSQKISNNAKAQGADVIITACPLCMYNLKKHTKDVPVIYFTELLAKALGIKE
ncbi:MAG: CoB--CoM heterodisulfide reductase iron-sulfur subunit B family protein [Clostridia bacterium]|nr:CoB--CoM heterodisulfide reductase iron-sulfur subunit B family protein [Clostridia bacterium]